MEVLHPLIRAASTLSEHIITTTLAPSSSSATGIVQKADHSPVTIADFAIQALLSSTVRAHFPSDAIVGEESAAQLREDASLLDKVVTALTWLAEQEGVEEAVTIPRDAEAICVIVDECGSSIPSAERRTWIFDPIDGTKTYMQGKLYAINAALVVDGEQAIGMVGCPKLNPKQASPVGDGDISSEGCVVFAVKGHGAWVQELGKGSEPPQRLERHGQDLGLDDIRFTSCTTVSSSVPQLNANLLSRLNVASSNDLLPWVLRWISLALNMANTTVWVYKSLDRRGKVWDHAGAMLIFEETGGVVSDVNGKKVSVVGSRIMEGNFGFVAAPGGLHAKVLEQVWVVMREMGHEGLLGA
ncbi:Protein of unknown functionlike protein [Emericellopsis cladophorae]|uniref:3'(2'),5'-bisphosphate nucleotidase n=1 Tax=Emericellopsis cladophorae TaxID=2686198 RepID=A0A9P9XXZ2_9HYPO|nr:Protein of unknown functionlike protein [Emericellopsis cladophorae]KAI6779384.1 Protein of unknown functionlike protein [Emericellopsis cladophorae]